MKSKILIASLVVLVTTGCAQLETYASNRLGISNPGTMSQTMSNYNHCRTEALDMFTTITRNGGKVITSHLDDARQEINFVLRGPNGRVATVKCQNQLLSVIM